MSDVYATRWNGQCSIKVVNWQGFGQLKLSKTTIEKLTCFDVFGCAFGKC
jgi:hypothetical protein